MEKLIFQFYSLTGITYKSDQYDAKGDTNRMG